MGAWEHVTGSQRQTKMQQKAHRRETTNRVGKSCDRDAVRQRQRRSNKETGRAGATLRLEADLGWGGMCDLCAGWYQMEGNSSFLA